MRRGEADFSCRRRENARSARRIASVAPHSFAVYGRRVCGDEPFLFFTDFHGDLAKAVREGQAKEFAGHAGHDASVPDPNDPRTFIRSKLDWQKAASEEGKPGCASRATLSSCAIAILSRCSRRRGRGGHDPARGGAGAGGELAILRRHALRGAEYRRGAGRDAGNTGRGHFSWPERQEALSPNSIVVRFAHGEASS